MTDTSRWYGAYQAVVRWLPAVGIGVKRHWHDCLSEIYDVAVGLEGEIILVAVAFKEANDPLLLFRRKQALAVGIAVVSAVTAQILLQLFTQRCVVFLLHLAEKMFETAGATNDADLLEVLALAVLTGSGVDSRTPGEVFWHFLPCYKAQAFTVTRTALAEAKFPAGWHFAEFERW